MNETIKKYLLGSTVIAGMMAASVAAPAYAQDDAADSDIIVTGTRITRPNLVAASPVTTIDREELLNTGITDIGDLVQSIPSMSGSPISTTTNNGGNGSVRVNLRGLGTARTLTLVNGQRTVDQGDFQTIPALMIERLDVLKDGASAVYGADAVAGVINIITRDEFDGIEVTAQHSLWDETNNGEQTTIAALAGKTFDQGSFVFGAEYVKQKEVYQRDTPWDFFQDSYYIYPGGCEAQVAAPYDGTTSGGCYPIGSSRIPESRLGFLTQGTFLVGTPATQDYEVGLITPHDGRNYNYAPVNYVQTPYDKLNAFAQGKFDVSDTTQFKFEIRGNRRESAQELAPQPYNSPTDPAYDGVFNGTAYSGISEDNYYLRRAVDAYNATNPATPLAYEPIRDARRRMIETTRRFTQDVSQVQSVVSLDGELDGVKWDVYANYGFRNIASRDFGQFSGNRLFNALGPSADLDGDGQPECYTDINDASTLIAGCVPLNFFGGGSVDRATGNITAQTLTQDMIDYVSTETNDTTDTEFVAAGFGLSGDAWELPGGTLGWAAGAGLWEQTLKDIPDSAKAAGEVTGNTFNPTSGKLSNLHVFGEVLAPVFDNGTQKLEIKGGARYDEFDNIGGKATYQIGATGQLNDSFRVRGTYGTVFRVPDVFDLFQGATDSFPQYTDPCRTNGPNGTTVTPAAGCAQGVVQLDTQVLAQVGGNPFLQPETGDSLTLGAVFRPDFIEGHNISLTVDYFKMNVDNGINGIGVNNTLEACYVDLNDGACQLITRRADYSVAQIIDTQLNVASDTAEGIDTEVRWNHEASFADLNASVIWTHLLERNFLEFEGGNLAERAGRFNGSSFPTDKVNYSFGLTKGIFNVAYRGEYISGTETNVAFLDYEQQIDSKLFHDLVVNADVEDYGLRLSAGVTNLTNEAPPYIDSGFNASTDPSTYRVLGRGFFLRGTKTF